MYIVCKWDRINHCYNYFNCFDSYSEAREFRDYLQRTLGSKFDSPFEIRLVDEI